MLRYRKIRVGKKYIEALCLNLQSKNLVLIKGRRGYIMCGYLNMKAAQKFQDAAVKITGISSIEEALSASVHSCTAGARKLGIAKGQPVREALKIIA